MGVGRGGGTGYGPPGFSNLTFSVKFSAKKDCYLRFESVKWNLTTFFPPGKNPLLAPPWKKTFRRPWMCHHCYAPSTKRLFNGKQESKESLTCKSAVLGSKIADAANRNLVSGLFSMSRSRECRQLPDNEWQEDSIWKHGGEPKQQVFF